jgi:hypothetical protein
VKEQTVIEFGHLPSLLACFRTLLFEHRVSNQDQRTEATYRSISQELAVEVPRYCSQSLKLQPESPRVEDFLRGENWPCSSAWLSVPRHASRQLPSFADQSLVGVPLDRSDGSPQ